MAPNGIRTSAVRTMWTIVLLTAPCLQSSPAVPRRTLHPEGQQASPTPNVEKPFNQQSLTNTKQSPGLQLWLKVVPHVGMTPNVTDAHVREPSTYNEDSPVKPSRQPLTSDGTFNDGENSQDGEGFKFVEGFRAGAMSQFPSTFRNEVVDEEQSSNDKISHSGELSNSEDFSDGKEFQPDRASNAVQVSQDPGMLITKERFHTAPSSDPESFPVGSLSHEGAQSGGSETYNHGALSSAVKQHRAFEGEQESTHDHRPLIMFLRKSDRTPQKHKWSSKVNGIGISAGEKSASGSSTTPRNGSLAVSPVGMKQKSSVVRAQPLELQDSRAGFDIGHKRHTPVYDSVRSNNSHHSWGNDETPAEATSEVRQKLPAFRSNAAQGKTAAYSGIDPGMSKFSEQSTKISLTHTDDALCSSNIFLRLLYAALMSEDNTHPVHSNHASSQSFLAHLESTYPGTDMYSTSLTQPQTSLSSRTRDFLYSLPARKHKLSRIERLRLLSDKTLWLRGKGTVAYLFGGFLSGLSTQRHYIQNSLRFSMEDLPRSRLGLVTGMRRQQAGPIIVQRRRGKTDRQTDKRDLQTQWHRRRMIQRHTASHNRQIDRKRERETERKKETERQRKKESAAEIWVVRAESCLHKCAKGCL